MDLKRSEVRVAVAKLLMLAYSEDEGLTTAIMAKKGNARLIINQNGKATLSGAAGILTFCGKPALEKLGVAIKRVKVNFSNEGNMTVGYSATFTLEIISMTVKGRFDLEALITSCSGLVCQAARAFRRRNRTLDMELKKIMGK